MADTVTKETVVLEIDVSTLAKSVGDGAQKLEAYKRELEAVIDAGGKFSEEAAIATAKVQAQAKEVNQLQGALTRITQADKVLVGGLQSVVKGYDASAKSIDQNRKTLNALTAEYVKTKNPSKEFADRIKNISDTLKQQEAAIGDNRRNVGNYKESIMEAAQSLPGLGKAMQGVNALAAASPMGALAETFGVLFRSVSSNKEVMDLLEQAMSGINSTSRIVVDSVVNMGKAFIENTSSMEKFGDSFVGIFKNSLAGYKEFGSELLKGNVGNALNGLAQGLTGVEDAGNRFMGVMREIAEVADITAKATKAQQDLDDEIREFNLLAAQQEVIIQRSIKASKDKTKSDEDRMALLKSALALEEEQLRKQQSFAAREEEIIKAKQKTFANNEDFEIALNKAQIDRANKQRESFVLQEKIQNELNALEVSIAEDRKKRFEEYQKQQEHVAGFQREFDAALIKQTKDREAAITEEVVQSTKDQISAEKRKVDEMKRLAEEEAKAEKELAKAKEEAASGVFNLFTEIGNALGEQSVAGLAFQKLAAGVQIAINTARSISAAIVGATEAAAAGGPAAPFLLIGYIASMIAAVVGAAAQATALLSNVEEPAPPQFAEGGGIPIHGKSHAEGGEDVVVGGRRVANVEGGEGLFVMKKNAYQDINKLGAWNMLYGGKSWAGSPVSFAANGGAITDGGFVARETSRSANELSTMKDMITQLVKSMPAPVVSVKEINRVNTNRTRAVRTSEL